MDTDDFETDPAMIEEEFQAEVIERLRNELHSKLAEGTHCVVCDQNAREYKRKINSGMAFALVTMYRRAGTYWFHKPTVLRGVGAAARDESLLRFWGLIEERYGKSPDGRAGWWRVTPKGEAFIIGGLKVPKYAHIYNGEFLRFSGPNITCDDAAGDRFSLSEMLDASSDDH